MKTRKVYQKPMMETEAFVPSAYCAICFKIACQAMGPDKYDSRCEHTPEACGDATNQYIRENGNGVLSMWEDSDDQGWLRCDVTSPQPFTWDEVQQNGGRVEWKTYAASGDGRVWTHWGIAERDQTTSNAS